MAYQAQINIKTTGLAGLNKINASVDRINKAIIQINKGGSKIKGGKEIVKINKQELEQKQKILKVETDIANQLQRQKTLRGKRGAGGATGTGGSKTGGGGSGALSSAVISGVFPLLFGQGPLAAIGGATGGFLGGKFGGQMGGFAGGLAGTATVTILQNAAIAIGEVGQAMSPFVQDIDKLVKVTGGSNSVISKQIQLIEASKGKQEAFNVAMRIMRQQVGEGGVQALKDFGDTTRLFGSQIDVALTKLGAFTAGIANFVTKILGIQSALEAAENQRIVEAAAAGGSAEAQDLVNRRTDFETGPRIGGRTGAKSRKAKDDELKADEKIFATRQKISIEADNLRAKSATALADKQKELDLNNKINQLVGQGYNKELAKTLATTEQTFDADKKILEEKQKQIQAAYAESVINNDKAEVQAQLRRDMIGIGEELRDHNAERAEALQLDKEISEATKDIKTNFEIIGESIASGVTDNITAAIQGTKSLGEAAKSILNDLSTNLIKLGVNTLFSKIPGFGGLTTLLPFANGGIPPVGKPSLVGEKGPELFVPKRSGTIIPNDKLAGGGSTNISVNVDASGSSVQSNEQQGKELGRVISAAIQSELIKQRRPGGLLR